VSVYGPDLPVWALLASGSTGGVRRTSLLTHRLDCVKSYHRLPTGSLRTLSVSWLAAYGSSSCRFIIYPLPRDVVKSRVQLRTAPPKGTPVQYIASELKAVVTESGV
jgi:solute carrier family 25 (mitochondrial carnitine/acylcarnitine transporter), member 20/29